MTGWICWKELTENRGFDELELINLVRRGLLPYSIKSGDPIVELQQVKDKKVLSNRISKISDNIQFNEKDIPDRPIGTASLRGIPSETAQTILEKMNEKFEDYKKTDQIYFDLNSAEQLRWILTTYLSTEGMLENWPVPSQVASKMAQLCKATEKFIDILESVSIDPESRHQFMTASDGDIDIEKTISMAHRIMYASRTESVARESNQKKKRSKKFKPKNLFISKLADFYEEKTGFEATVGFNVDTENFYGPFFDFVEICFKEIGEPIHSRNSLGSTIQRVRKNRIIAEEDTSR